MHFLSVADWSADQIQSVIGLALKVKNNPKEYAHALAQKTLMMFFQKPSLRTRTSFEVAMVQLGGHAIYYDLGSSPWSKGKESIPDTAKVVSRFCDAITARLYSHQELAELAQHATIPVINALTDYEHPCQILGDLMSIHEKKGLLSGLKLAYLGDGNNNVTHSLLFGCSLMGMHIAIGCPKGADYEPQPSVLAKAREFAKSHKTRIEVFYEARTAVANADVVYTDSWMSYHIPEEKKDERFRIFQPYQVNAQTMNAAKPSALFMNCLPAQRGAEQTAEVIDGAQSIVFDQAENRLHIQKAILLTLIR
jgi:ornithine carbamoyltransferase